jgi:hypothetical protein
MDDALDTYLFQKQNEVKKRLKSKRKGHEKSKNT